MIVIYLLFGAALLFTDFLADKIASSRELIGIVFVGYSLFRAFGIYRDLKNTGS
jgi:hypothetical protein